MAGPELTNSRTREPRSTDVPSLGEVRVAKPLRTEPEASVSAVTSRPCFWSSRMASWREVLRTEGTRTLPGPRETISVIVSEAAAVSPASGSWRRTVSTSALLRSRSTCDLLEAVALEPVAGLGQRQPLDLGHRRLLGPGEGVGHDARSAASTSAPISHGSQRRFFSSSSSPSPTGTGATATAAKSLVPLSLVAVACAST